MLTRYFTKINRLFRVLLVTFLILPIPVFADETTTTTTTTTTIPVGEVEETETFDGTTTTTTIVEDQTTTTSSTTTTTVPETWEQSTDIIIPEDQVDLNGNETQNNIDINNDWSGQYGCENYCINLEYQQHGGDGENYIFDLPDDHDIYEVSYNIGALNNQGTVTYTHTDETNQTNVLEAQQYVTAETMYEKIVYNIRTTLETFIDSFTISINDWTLVDNISFKYVTTTTTTSTTTSTLPPKSIEEIEIEQQEEQTQSNFAETGIYETDAERQYREDNPEVFEAIEEENKATEVRDQERSDNEQKYGCYMTNAQIERGDCFDIEEETEEEVIIILEDDEKTDDTEKEFFDDDDMVFDVEDEDDIENLDEEVIDLETLEEEIIIEIEEDLDLSEEEKQELIEVIKDIQETDFEEFVIEEEEIVFDEIIIIIEEDEEEIFEDEKHIDEIKDNQQDLEEDTQEVVATIPVLVEDVDEEFTEEEIIVFVEEAEEAIEEIISVEEVVEILDQEELEELSEEELIEYEEEKKKKIIEAVKELPVEEKVAVVEEVAKVSVQNLAVADKQTKTVVQAVVTEVVQPEVIETLDETQKEAVAEVLGVEETNDVEIIAEQAKKDDNINIAVQEYVERATENADVENYSVSNAIVEVQVEQFFEDPLGQLTDIDLSDIVLSDIGSDMTQSSKDNAKKTVVPVIIVSQIIATPFTRRF